MTALSNDETKTWRQVNQNDVCHCRHSRGMHYSSSGSQSLCNMKNCRCTHFWLERSSDG